jgi:hypothetical protein
MSKPLIVSNQEGTSVWLPANPEMLEIARLYLEKYETLEPDDRKLFRKIILQFNAGTGRFIEGATVKEAA